MVTLTKSFFCVYFRRVCYAGITPMCLKFASNHFNVGGHGRSLQIIINVYIVYITWNYYEDYYQVLRYDRHDMGCSAAGPGNWELEMTHLLSVFHFCSTCWDKYCCIGVMYERFGL